MKNQNTKKLAYAALFLALCLVLPMLTGQIPQIGSMLLPMHIPVLLCGLVEPVYFTAVILLIVVSSVATPLALKALFTKMPPVPHPSEAKE